MILNHLSIQQLSRPCHIEASLFLSRCLHRYRNGQEFYRYIPTDTPDTTVFPYPGIYVDVRSSHVFGLFLRIIWMWTRISVFSGVQVLRDQNNLTESRSRHDGDVQVMKHSIFHHCQTSNIWSRDRECLIKAYILQLSDIRSCYMRGKKAKYFQNMTNCAQTSILIVHSYANLQIFCHNKCTVAKREMQDKEFQHLSTLAIFQQQCVHGA